MRQEKPNRRSGTAKIPPKQRILNHAVELFAQKGYTETTTRELAAAVGLKGSSLYSHFPSKKAILEYILEDFMEHITRDYMNKDIPAVLRENPDTDGILDCLLYGLPKGWDAYYRSVLNILLQEQHRNPIMHRFMSEKAILPLEQNACMIIGTLKTIGIIHQDTDPDFWMKTFSSLYYTFANRYMLGLGEDAPGFTGMGTDGLLRFLFDMMLKTCGVKAKWQNVTAAGKRNDVIRPETPRPNDSTGEISSKQKILNCAAELFAKKGYTETTIRELAAAVGLKGSSIYSHFPSKKAILEYILEDYTEHIALAKEDIPVLIRENPTTDGIIACLPHGFPEGRKEYYLKVLEVLMQEQHRNPIVRRFLAQKAILLPERNVKTAMDELQTISAIRPDTDPDFWMKVASSLHYAFANRYMLGIGEDAPDFTGMGLDDLLRRLFDLMLETCGTGQKNKSLP